MGTGAGFWPSEPAQSALEILQIAGLSPEDLCPENQAEAQASELQPSTQKMPSTEESDMSQTKPLIIDVHGHYTTAPKALEDWRNRQIAGIKDPSISPKVSELKVATRSREKLNMKHFPLFPMLKRYKMLVLLYS